MQSNEARYDGWTIGLHWITAVLVLALFGTAVAWDFFPRESGIKQVLEPLHVSMGILLAAAILVRLVWRSGFGRRLAHEGSAMVKWASRLVHFTLYGLLFVQVGLGFSLRWMQGDSLSFFGLFAIPSPFPADREFSRFLEGTHNVVAWSLIYLAAGHAAAALFHHYARHDGVLRRMLPGTRRRTVELYEHAMDFTFFGLVPMLFGGVAADSPRALLDSIYQPLLVGERTSVEQHYSERLQELVAANIELNAVDENGGRIDPEAAPVVEFNPFLNGDRAVLSDLKVTEPLVSGETAVSLVSFDNEGGETILSVSMIRSDGEWKVDDIASVGSGEKWLYSWLLQYDPFGEQ